MRAPITLTKAAERDLRRIGLGPDAQRIGAALRSLETNAANLDVVSVSGHPGWLRLRVGDWRILYRLHAGSRVMARIVNRRDLEAAVRSLE